VSAVWINDRAFGSEKVIVMGIGMSGVRSRGKKLSIGA